MAHLTGEEFVFAATAEAVTLWGNGERALWVDGEGLMLAGPQGVGKSLILQQLMFARMGKAKELLGLHIPPAEGKCLYLALDRPAQIKRSMARMVNDEDRWLLRERMAVWSGPLPPDVRLAEPHSLPTWIRDTFGEGVTDVFTDSYKDIAVGLSKDETASQVNLMVQATIAAGMQWVGAHHNRKSTAENRHPRTLDDIYGGTWLTAGLGSVVSMYGQAGDVVIECKHIKQPFESLGRFSVRHNHTDGTSWLTDEVPVIDGRSKPSTDRRERIKEHLQAHPDAQAPEVKDALKLKEAIRTVREDVVTVREEIRQDELVARLLAKD
jgi:hypothetical protein